MKISKRLETLPPYLFAELDRMKEEKKKLGVDVISLGVGDPDMPTAPIVIEAMKKAVEKPEHHQYPAYEGSKEFRTVMANYYKRRFNADLDPSNEIISLIGSKEGIAHLSMAVLDPGDLLLVPDPGYPVYSVGASFAGADTYKMPLLAENKFLPDFTKIPEKIARKAAMMFINYPNNPTAASANLDFYSEAVEFAKKYDIILASDNAYSEVYFDGEAPPSVLGIPGAKDVAVEFYSLSKPFNMTGWRIGAFLGNTKIVGALGTFKKNIDSGTFTAIQEASAYALTHGDDFVSNMRKIYRVRRDKMIKGLKEIGINVESPESTFYIWAPTPGGKSSFDFTRELLDSTGVLVSPGTGFGEYGEGYFRISLTVPDERIDEAVERLRKFSVACVK